MDKWDKLLQEFIGKDKVESISIKHNLKTNKWVYKFREVIEDKKYTSTINFDDRWKAEKFHFHFGGKNPNTCSAPELFNKLGAWNSEEVMELGHRITEIGLVGDRVIRDTHIEIPLPKNSGHDWLISKRKKKTGNIAKFLLNDNERCNITRVFTNHSQFDTFVKFLATNDSLKNLVFVVRFISTENEETGDKGYWNRCMAKDGTNRMILELKTINDICYTEIMYHEILGFADGMADGECRKINRGKKVQKKDTICFFAAKNGQIKGD